MFPVILLKKQPTTTTTPPAPNKPRREVALFTRVFY